MTEEEAVEEVLKGPFSTCTRCKGSGFYNSAFAGFGTCQNCDGTGKWERGDYKQACVILNIEPKRLPPPKTSYKGDAFSVSFWNRTLSADEVTGLYQKGVQQAQREATFQKEYMGGWSFDGEDDKIEFKRVEEVDDTVEAMHYAITYSNEPKP
jgi:hypothetical protein